MYTNEVLANSFTGELEEALKVVGSTGFLHLNITETPVSAIASLATVVSPRAKGKLGDT